MKNTLLDLNNHLFAEIERLADEDLVGEELEEEMKRAKAVCDVSGKIIDNGRLLLTAEKFRREYIPSDSKEELPKMLDGRKNEQKP